MKTKSNTGKMNAKKPRRAKPTASVKSVHAPSVNRSTRLENPEILTLHEAASFLRVAEDDVKKMAETGKLPARQVGNEWRFLRSAILEWFRHCEAPTLSSKERMVALAGAWKDDETFPQLMEAIHASRKQRDESEK